MLLVGVSGGGEPVVTFGASTLSRRIVDTYNVASIVVKGVQECGMI